MMPTMRVRWRKTSSLIAPTWLLVLVWNKFTLWLRRLFVLLLRPPLMRLGFVSQDHRNGQMRLTNWDENDVDAEDAVAEIARREDETEYLLLIQESPDGLVNLGNNCFVNAVLQCLRVVPGFFHAVEQEVTKVRRILSDRGDVQRNNRSQQALHVADTLLHLLQGISPTERVSYHEVEDDGDGNGPMDADPAHIQRRRTAIATQKRQRYERRERNRERLERFLNATSKCADLIHPVSSEQEQQDAEEFLSFLLELLHDLLRQAYTFSAYPEDETQLMQQEQFCQENLKASIVTKPQTYTTGVAQLGEVRWQRYLRQNASVITYFFTGQTVRGSHCCSCANLTCIHQEVRVLPLTVMPGVPNQSVVDCFKLHRDVEEMTDENRVYCNGYCAMNTNHKTQVLLQRVPPVLILQLQRFKHTWLGSQVEKNTTPVRFPMGSELLDITSNVFIRDDSERVLFQLVAICAHIGNSLDSGHYVAYIRHPEVDQDCDDMHATTNHRWLKLDDDVVSALDEESFRKETLSTAYLLFYTRTETVGINSSHVEEATIT